MTWTCHSRTTSHAGSALRGLRVVALAAFAALAFGWGLFGDSAAHARQLGEEPSHLLPGDLEGVDIIERLDNTLPLDLRFTDDSGREIALGELFDGTVPVILQVGYNRCPMLCNLVLNELIKSLKTLEWESPERFRLISLSVDPTESHELASLKKQAYLLQYGDPGAARGWHFLTGSEENARAFADAVGFGYRWVPETQEYAHAAVIILLTPDGRVSRYLYGVRYRAADLRLGLLEASEGKIGTTLERFLLWCYVYDHEARGYVLFAMRLMRLGGAVTLVLLSGTLALLWIRELRRSRAVGSVPSPSHAA